MSAIPNEVMSVLRMWADENHCELSLIIKDGINYADVREEILVRGRAQEIMRYKAILPPWRQNMSEAGYVGRVRGILDQMRDRQLRERAWGKGLAERPPWICGEDRVLDMQARLINEYSKKRNG